MQKSFTIKDVAGLAGVSTATVSLVVNRKEGVKPQTRDKVLRAIERLNYTPNVSARKLIDQKSRTIGLVVTDITNPFFGSIVSEVDSCVSERGYSLSLAVSNDSMLSESKCIKRFQGERAEGIIIIPSINADFSLAYYDHLDVPFVFMTTFYENIASDCVMCDLRKGSYLLTKYCLEKGRRKIFFVGGEPEAAFTRLRIEGYLQAYEESGYPNAREWIINIFPDEKAKSQLLSSSGHSISSHYLCGYNAAGSIISANPDTILTVNDQVAMGALKCLKDHGIRVPQDVWLAGYDDVMYASLLETPLTTVRQPIREMAEKTVEVLFKRMETNNRPMKTYFVEPVLKLRSTTE